MELKAHSRKSDIYDTDEAADYLTNQRRVRTAAQTLAKYVRSAAVQDFSTSAASQSTEKTGLDQLRK